MKNLLLTAFLFSILIVNAFSQTATITVFSQDGEKFWVIMNGIKQNETPMTNVKVTGLSLPNYKLKIIFDDEKIPAIDKDIMTKNYDNVLCDQAYVIKKDKKGNFVMRLNSFEPTKEITTTVEPNQVAVPFTTVERAEKPVQTQQTKPTQVQQTTSVTTTNSKDNSNNLGVNVKDPVTGESINMNMNISATGIGVDVKDPSGTNVNMNVGTKDNTSKQTTVTSTTTTTTTTYGRDNRDQADKGQAEKDRLEKERIEKERADKERADKEQAEKHQAYKLQGYNGPIGCEYPISAQDFDDAKKSISSKSFEDSKLTIAKQITASNCLLTSQVKEIMKLFSFEDSKLEFAKYAYQYTFDVGNYYKVNDAFTFEMSINDLNEYISAHKK